MKLGNFPENIITFFTNPFNGVKDKPFILKYKFASQNHRHLPLENFPRRFVFKYSIQVFERYKIVVVIRKFAVFVKERLRVEDITKEGLLHLKERLRHSTSVERLI